LVLGVGSNRNDHDFPVVVAPVRATEMDAAVKGGLS
jgi:hypothetical protein